MNGTQLLGRSASMVLACSFLFVAACGVEMNGLFDGDAGIDGASAGDAGRDASSPDRALDVRVDASADSSSGDGSLEDRSTADGVTADRGSGDVTTEPPPDVRADANPTRDVSSIDGRDIVDGDASNDASFDGDGLRDARGEPFDATSEDATADPSFDAVIDAVADARADSDGADAEPPITCSGSCNTFDNISPTITRTVNQGLPPAMTGGTIVDGTYVVSSIVQYNGDATSYSLAETSVITGNFDAWVASTNGQLPVRYTTTFTTVGNQLMLSVCCPAPGSLTISYTTDGTTLAHVDPLNSNRVITYTRQ
jgi:hypothetical protein